MAVVGSAGSVVGASVVVIVVYVSISTVVGSGVVGGQAVVYFIWFT